MSKSNPSATYVISVLVVAVNIVSRYFFKSSDIWYIALVPSQVMRLQLWRLVTYSVFHTGYVHLFINIIAFIQVGSTLEPLLGRLSFIVHLIWFCLLTSFIYCGIGKFLTLTNNYLLYNSPILGMTSLILALSVLKAHISRRKRDSFLWVVLIPTKAYPLALGILAHICLPNASFFGHISGLLAGGIQFIAFEKLYKNTRSPDRRSKRHRRVKENPYDSPDSEDTTPFALINYFCEEKPQTKLADAL